MSKKNTNFELMDENYDYSALGKRIYEREMPKFNESSRMYIVESEDGRYKKIMKYAEYKYFLNRLNDSYMFKHYEQDYLYEGFVGTDITEVTETIYKKTDGILYHLTTEANLNKIIKRGLIPKNWGSYIDEYPERVYFFYRKDPHGFEKQARYFYESIK